MSVATLEDGSIADLASPAQREMERGALLQMLSWARDGDSYVREFAREWCGRHDINWNDDQQEAAE